MAIYVTQPTLAPISELTPLLESVWASGVMTHNGPLVQKFEKDFSAWAGLPHPIVANCNGTFAIQMAIRALQLKGEIITSPFTFIATISAIQAEGCTPVFGDIDPDTLNLDPKTIEAKITPNTVAIMPVHVFGVPCDIDAIQAIADKHGLKVIYDAAHAVGSTYKGKSALSYGDIAATSFHATKMLNTAEGGGCYTSDPALIERLKAIRFFGFDNSKEVVLEGYNGKMTEVHAAVGLANLKYLDAALADRKAKYKLYKSILEKSPRLRFQRADDTCNCSYFPVIFETEELLLKVEAGLNAKGFFPRRYFYPSVNTFTKIVPYQPCPVSEDVSKRILCLPHYFALASEQVEIISNTILEIVG